MQRSRISNGKGLVSQAEYARRLGVARSTVNRQIQRGVFPLHDGKVNAAEADRCRADQLDSFRGRNTVAQRREAAMKPEDASTVPFTRDEVQKLCDMAYRDGQVAVVTGLVRPGNLVAVAELASAMECSLPQSVNLANLYRLMLMAWSLDDSERIEVEEPNWVAFAAEVGEKVTRKQIKAWMAETGPAIEKWYTAHPGEKPEEVKGAANR